MKLLLDQGLPRSTAEFLRKSGFETVHAAECNLSTADDDTILAAAHSNDQIVVTLESGAAVSVREGQVRVHNLPLRSSPGRRP